MKLLRSITPVVFCLLAVAPALAADEKAAKITGQDVVGRPGEAAKLRARLEKIGYLGVNPSVEGAFLDFYLLPPAAPEGAEAVQAKFIGSGQTDGSGWAELAWTPEAAGLHELEARIRKGSDYISVPASILLLAPAAGGRTVVCDVEKTLTGESSVKFVTAAPKELKAIDGAKEALEAVNKDHPLVYMTGVEASFVGKVQDWLKLRGFPKGPVFAWDLGKNALSGEAFKIQVLTKLKTEAGGLALAIGGRTEDATAAIKISVCGYFVGAREKDLPKEAVWARQWSDVPALVARQHAVEALIKDAAGADPAKRATALKDLATLEVTQLGFIVRSLRASDHSVAAAAALVTARVRAREAFAASLDLTTPANALASLEAAWAHGDDVITARLYRGGAKGLEKGRPALAAYRAIELVSRTEPEPGKVVSRLRFVPTGDGAPAERDYPFVRAEDGRWLADPTE